MLKFVFIAALALSCYAQVKDGRNFAMVDTSIWSNQAKYVETNDPKQYDLLLAYGHPGGPIILGTLGIHRVLGLSYYESLALFLTIFDSIIIAFICALCYALRKNLLWCVTAFGLLVFNPIFYTSSTPPSLVASLLFILLTLFSLYLFGRKGKSNWQLLALWCICAGLLAATRVDAGVLGAGVLLVALTRVLPLRKTAAMAAGSFIAFSIFDPFMWYMPIRHIGDLMAKIFLHYAQFDQAHIGLYYFLKFSALGGVGFFLALVFIYLQRRRKIDPPLPTYFAGAICLMTVIHCAVFLTSKYQAQRYLQPSAWLWEVLLPLYFFALTSQLRFGPLGSGKRQARARTALNVLVAALMVTGTYLSA